MPGGVGARCASLVARAACSWAASTDGMNKGLFQQPRYWDVNFDLYTRPVWKLRPAIVSGRTNAIVSIRMAHDIGWRLGRPRLPLDWRRATSHPPPPHHPRD